MTREQTPLEDLIESLKQQRDEIRVQIHLAQADAREEWDELEKKWDALEHKLAAVTNEAGDAAKDVGSALGIVADELKHAYQRIRRRL